MKLAFWFCVTFVLYTYAGYPLIMYTCSRLRRCSLQTAPIFPFVSIIMAVRNEEAFIYRKLQNLNDLDYPRDHCEVIVISDGSTDSTNDLLAAYPGENMRILISKEHLGKAAAINKAVAFARGEIVVFTDARQLIGRDSIRRLVEDFGSPSVGCVTGELVMGEPEEGGQDARHFLVLGNREEDQKVGERCGLDRWGDGRPLRGATKPDSAISSRNNP